MNDEKIIKEANEGVIEKASEGVIEKASEGVIEKASEGVIEKASEGVIEKTNEGVIGKVNVSILLEKMPSIVIIATTAFLILSFAYNTIYFFALGIDIGLVPLTLADYVLTARMYVYTIASIVIGVLFGIMGAQNSDKNTLKASRAEKIWQILLILFLVAFCLLIIFMNLYQSFVINIYHIDPFLGLIFLIILLLPKKNQLIRIILFILLCVAIYFGDSIKVRVVDSFSSGNYYLHGDGKKYKLLRTFEKGVLVANEDYHVSFLYLDGKTLIEFEPNLELIEYLKSEAD